MMNTIMAKLPLWVVASVCLLYFAIIVLVIAVAYDPDLDGFLATWF